MKHIKIFVCMLIICSVTFNITSVFGVNMVAITTGNFLNDIVSEGKNFFSGSGTDVGGVGGKIRDLFQNDVADIIGTVGNLIFYVVAAFLGLKYIWSGVEGKSQVKETLPTFVVGACVFYLSKAVYDFTTGVISGIAGGSTFDIIQGNLWQNISFVVNIFAIAGIVALGLKYMLSSADTRADIKKDMVPVVIGLILVYSITNVLNFLVNTGNQILP